MVHFSFEGEGFELKALHLQSSAWATPPAHFALVILEMGVLWTICPVWPQTVISASQVARVTGVSFMMRHQAQLSEKAN
jgi:hypothetical protein